MNETTLGVLVGLLFFGGLTYLIVTAEPVKRLEETIEIKETQTHKSNNGGMGMTYTGRIGIELSPGIILPFDGSGINFGFGF